MHRLTALAAVFLCACATKPEAPSPEAAAAKPPIVSEFTDLSEPTCRKEVDRSHPNEISYLVCPGVVGYTLNVRRVEAGKRSVEVVEPGSQRAFPLEYQDVITRSMFSLDPKAEWRVATRDGRAVPIALIVGIQAHEDSNRPETVTTRYVAVAKITPQQVCVTDRFANQQQSAEAVHRAADSAPDKPCAPALASGQN